MIYIRSTFLCMIAISISGCAGLIPQTPEEYKENSLVSLETYSINRPFSRITKDLKARSAKCLNSSVIIHHCLNGGGCSENKVVYKPTLISKKNKTSLYVQLDNPKYEMWEPPAGGMYIAVAEATPIPGGKTEVKLYSKTFGWQAVPDAIKHWVHGTNSGCPNLAEDDH